MPITRSTDGGEVRTHCRWCGTKFDDQIKPVQVAHMEGCTACVPNCGNCGVKVSPDSIFFVGGAQWCSTCATVYSKICSICSERYDKRTTVLVSSSGYVVVCPNCYTQHFWTCSFDSNVTLNSRECNMCGRDKDGNKPRCPCRRGTSDDPVHDYSCKPNLVFHGKSRQRIHMGFELETRIGDGNSSSAIRTAALFAMKALQGPEIAELKSDSSIGGGFEIVTQPHTYEKYRDDSQLLWDTIETLRKDYKARSWDARTCGLHIHVARNAFSDGQHTHRFIEFIYRNAEMMAKFAGRHDKHYASFHDCWKTDDYSRPKFDIEHKLKRHGEDSLRGTAVNTTNEHTLELRFFRGTMNPSGVRSALGLAHAMIQYTRAMIVPEDVAREITFAWEPFKDWVYERASEYPDLMERMPLIKDVDINRIPTIDA